MQVTSRVVERLKTLENGKYKGKLKIGWRQSLMPSPLFRNKTIAIAAYHYGEIDIKVF